MRFAICNEIFSGWPPERAFPFAAATGYDGVEIAPFTLAPLVTGVPAVRRREIARIAGDAGIAVSGIHWVLAHTEGMHVNHPDPAWRARASDYLRHAVDFCADLGGTRMIFGSPRRRDVLPGVDPGDARGWTLDTFRPAVRLAEDRGVVICMEPLAPSETNFLNTAADTRALADAMGSAAFSVMLDVKAMCSEAGSPAEVIRAMAGRFDYFHANDRNLKGPGFGDTDFVPIGAALRESGYDGWVSVEVFDFAEGPEVIATRSLRHLRETVSPGDDGS
jgi:sugar phosphate isomerase/epimerase